MPRLMLASQSTAAKRQVYFHLVDATDGLTAETGEAAGQPQISTNGAAWTNTGIGTLTAIGNGRYYAELTQAAVATAGDVIETRYKSANTAECPGDTVQVVAFDPDDAAGLGLSRVDAAVGSRLATAGYTAPDNTGITAIKAKTDNLPASPAATGDAMTLTAGERASVVDATWDEGTSSHLTAGSAGVALVSAASSSLAPSAASIADSVWDEAHAGHLVAGSTGISLLAASSSSNAPSAAAIADSVWDEATAGHLSAGSAGKSLVDSASGSIAATTVWNEVLPGSHADGTAGRIMSQVSGSVEQVKMKFRRGFNG